MPLPEDIWLPIAFLIGAAVFWFGRRAVAWADLKTFERAIDAIMFGVLVAVAIRTSSEFIRIMAAASAALLLIGWFVAWRRR